MVKDLLFPTLQRVSIAAVVRVFTAIFTLGYTALGRVKVLSSIPSLWRKLSVGCSKLFWGFCLVF